MGNYYSFNGTNGTRCSVGPHVQQSVSAGSLRTDMLLPNGAVGADLSDVTDPSITARTFKGSSDGFFCFGSDRVCMYSIEFGVVNL